MLWTTITSAKCSRTACLDVLVKSVDPPSVPPSEQRLLPPFSVSIDVKHYVYSGGSVLNVKYVSS